MIGVSELNLDLFVLENVCVCHIVYSFIFVRFCWVKFSMLFCLLLVMALVLENMVFGIIVN